MPAPPRPAYPLSSEMLHATTVAVGDRAVVIEGRSGSGKSDLALRLIDRGARLVADDQTLLVRRGEAVLARAPATIAGRIEVRGLGIVPMPHDEDVAVGLVVMLDTAPDRMPMPGTRRIAGVDVREIAIDPFAASAPIKVELALAHPQLPPR